MNQCGGVATFARSGPKSAGANADLQRLIDEAKARHDISDLIGRYTTLKRAGPRELVGLCPFHKERTPSFRVNDDKGAYHCFGCGSQGDHIRFIMDKEGIGFIAALRYLGAAELPVVDPAERAKRREDMAREAEEMRRAAIHFFADASWIEGTEGERYLRARGITQMPEVAGTVRFGMVPAWRDKKTGAWGKPRPALVCGCQDVNGYFTGIQRIYVDGPAPDKAAVKLTLGRIRGSALRLGPIQNEILVTEGPEDGLTLRQQLPGRTVFVACGTGLMPFIEFPPEVESVVIAGQNNDAGRAAVQTAAEAYYAHGLTVRSIYPRTGFDDWNDELRGVPAHG